MDGHSRGFRNQIVFLIHVDIDFFIDFPSILEANLGPKIDQNRSKIDVKMTSHVELIFGSIFD